MFAIGALGSLSTIGSIVGLAGSLRTEDSGGLTDSLFGSPSTNDNTSFSSEVLEELIAELMETVNGSGDGSSADKAAEMGIPDLFGGPREDHPEDPGWEQVHGSGSSGNDSASKAAELGIEDKFGGPRPGHPEDPR